MHDLQRVLQYFRTDLKRLGGVALALLVSAGLNVLKPWPLALIVDCVLNHKRVPQWMHFAWYWTAPQLLAALVAALLLLYLLQAALVAWQNYMSIAISLNGLSRVRNELFQKLQNLSLRDHQRLTSGDLIYRASWDTYAIQTLFQQGAVTCASAVLSLVVMLFVMARMNADLTLLSIVLAPLLVFTIKSFGARMRQSTATAQSEDSRVTSLVQQGIQAVMLIQSFTREETMAQKFSGQVSHAQVQRRTQHGWEVVYGLAVAVIFGLGTATITWVGAVQVIRGRLTTGELLVFLAYLTQLFEPLNQLSHAGATVAGAMSSARRVFEILDQPDELRPWSTAPSRSTRAAGDLSLNAVSFAYERGQEVLCDISLTVKAGESVALIGVSGVGKTTLLYLLTRFLNPTSGVIELDGVDMRDWQISDLRKQIAFVSQEPILLCGTIAENIGFGKPGATIAEIESAARAANADGFIQKLPAKYETLVGDGAVRLSAGERQRIHLARAFLKDAPVLLLDEPTSALDVESENLIVESLRELIKNRTTILVAHRAATIAAAQRVIRLQNGQLVAGAE